MATISIPGNSPLKDVVSGEEAVVFQDGFTLAWKLLL